MIFGNGRYVITHDTFVDSLVDSGVLSTPEIIKAFRAIDRADFVPEELHGEAYANIPLPIGAGQTISQPYTVAYMLELLQPQRGENILEIGFGSGWQTALLAHIVGESGHVTAVEIIPELCAQGNDNIAKYGFRERGVVEMHCTNGTDAYVAHSPFDKIIAAASGKEVPDAWRIQTKVGGRIVAPFGSSILQMIKKSDGTWEQHEHPGFAFVPLVEKR